MEPLVDTHCHLVLLEERGLLQQALESALQSGVTQIVSVGLNLEDSDRNRDMAERYPGVFFTVGWHPHEKRAPDSHQMDALAELLQHPRAVAVGEIGLDAYFRPGYHETPMEEQTRAIESMLELAQAQGKPVVVHDRDAHEEIHAVLVRHQPVRGIMHCFSGDAGFAARCTAIGYIVSFSGIVTFPKADAICAAARAMGEQDFVVETDAPFLAPVPHRGRPNLPGYVADTAAAVAHLRGDTVAAVRATTTANARRLLKLPLTDTLV